MDYEFAKKLKDAEFPHSFHSFEGIKCANCDAECLPTLSELIEACGDNFRSLIYQKNHDNKYQANAYEGFGKNNWAYGQTPEEAVANLWLALNQE